MNKKIKSVGFVFENCECVEIPFECFVEFEIKDIEKLSNEDTFESFKCVIEDKGGTKYTCGGFGQKTPIQRMDYYNDITSIYITYNDNSQIQLFCPWYEENECCNSQYDDYQTSKMQSFNRIELNIINNSKWYNLEEILNKFEDGVKVKDQEENIYTIYYEEDNGLTYLFDTTVNNKILNSRFQKVI
jgi:hypothetical protein